MLPPDKLEVLTSSVNFAKTRLDALEEKSFANCWNFIGVLAIIQSRLPLRGGLRTFCVLKK